jgi:hypothetical protein
MYRRANGSRQKIKKVRGSDVVPTDSGVNGSNQAEQALFNSFSAARHSAWHGMSDANDRKSEIPASRAKPLTRGAGACYGIRIDDGSRPRLRAEMAEMAWSSATQSA